jgi:serine/threonine-protein kinase
MDPTMLPPQPAHDPNSTQRLAPDRPRQVWPSAPASMATPDSAASGQDDPLITTRLDRDASARPSAPPRERTLTSAVMNDGATIGVGTILAGKYELVRLLGAGGMGNVWKADHLSLGVPVAVKTMHAHVAMQSEYVRRFRREAHAASLLNHPNAVRVLDFGEDAGALFLVMEYLEGRSLGAWLSSLRAPPPLVEVARIFAMLLDAFDVAHAFGIVHRDLKPDNVFLADVGERRVAKVLDFGLAHVDDARDAGPTLTQGDAIAGTPGYMSPEQCRSLAVGPSADLYSLGCVLTTLLQLQPPFTGGASIDTMARHMFARPPPLERPEESEPVPPLLEKLRLDLLAKVAERRPRDAADAKRRLIEAMSPDATEARLPTRKGDVPLGDRAARSPSWAPPRMRSSIPPSNTKMIGVCRLPPPVEAVGIEPACETALAAQQVEIVTLQAPAAVAYSSLPLVVLDVGSSIPEGCAAIQEIRSAAPGTRIIVCAAKLSAGQLSELVAAGASDVARYPITPDDLARKIDRVLRRGR